MVYTLIEMVDIDIISVRTFLDEAKAILAFEKVAEENGANIIGAANWGNNVPASLAMFAGDDTYSVELHATNTEN